MISVVIPAYNEAKYIAACLEALTTQKTSQEFEVIVVDNASTDNTTSTANSFLEKLPLRVIHEPEKGRGAARRAGCDAARGDIILTTDADVIAPSNWVETMANSFTDEKVIGITGTCYITDQSRLSNAIFNFIQPAVTHLHRLAFGTYWVCGSNGGFRKKAYEKTAGYNITLNSMEDTQLSFLLHKQGLIRHVKKSRVETSGRRFKKSIVLGLLEYVKPFLERFLLGRKNIILRDVR